MNAVPDATMYVTSLREILRGIVLVASTMIIHRFGMWQSEPKAAAGPTYDGMLN